MSDDPCIIKIIGINRNIDKNQYNARLTKNGNYTTCIFGTLFNNGDGTFNSPSYNKNCTVVKICNGWKIKKEAKE